jgi:hypothetical protein
VHGPTQTPHEPSSAPKKKTEKAQKRKLSPFVHRKIKSCSPHPISFTDPDMVDTAESARIMPALQAMHRLLGTKY